MDLYLRSENDKLEEISLRSQNDKLMTYIAVDNLLMSPIELEQTIAIIRVKLNNGVLSSLQLGDAVIIIDVVGPISISMSLSRKNITMELIT